MFNRQVPKKVARDSRSGQQICGDVRGFANATAQLGGPRTEQRDVGTTAAAEDPQKLCTHRSLRGVDPSLTQQGFWRHPGSACNAWATPLLYRSTTRSGASSRPSILRIARVGGFPLRFSRRWPGFLWRQTWFFNRQVPKKVARDSRPGQSAGATPSPE